MANEKLGKTECRLDAGVTAKMHSTTSEHSPKSVVSAAISLLSWAELQDSLKKTKVHGHALRLQIPVLVPRDLFLPWLSAQRVAHKLFFRARHSAFQIAAIGFSYRASGPIYSSAVHHELLSILDSDVSDMRFYGAARFHNAPVHSPSPEWVPYGGYTFVLPAVELLSDIHGNVFLAANYYHMTGLEVLRSVLQNVISSSFSRVSKSPLKLIPRATSVEDLTDFSMWDDTMNEILKDLTSHHYDKIVLARRKQFTFHRNAPPCPLHILAALADQNSSIQKYAPHLSQQSQNNGLASDVPTNYPADANAYLFCLQLDYDKAFLGCTPERLFKLDGTTVLTEALAATVRRTPHEDEHRALETLLNEKNVNEHRFVVDDVTAAMSRCELEPHADGPHVRRLPRLMHLVTHITAQRPSTRVHGAPNDVFRLLSELHPTPAVCGVPRDTTISRIAALERFDRGLFAGPFGWFSAHKADFCVAIRSATVHGLYVTAYAGSGIVQASESRSEWDETELKMSAFTDLFSTESALVKPAKTLSFKPTSKRNPKEMNGFHKEESAEKKKRFCAVNGHENGSGNSREKALELSREYFDPGELERLPNINSVWGCCIVEELCRNGVTTFFISPGSRSAPLALGVVRSRHARFFVAHDERGAGFLAVGYARATGCAAAVVTSSGTAVANLFPGTVEAAMDELPLVLVTADRPPELRDVGANQAISQPEMFGKYVTWSKDVACPDYNMSLRNILSDVDYAVHRSGSGSHSGNPVHFNLMFRESLAPDSQSWDTAFVADVGLRWRLSLRPQTEYRPVVSQDGCQSCNCENDFRTWLWQLIKNKRQGLILLGSGLGGVQCEDDGLLVYEISALLKWPIVSDICGGLRLDATIRGVVHYADLLAEVPVVKNTFAPDCVLQFGERVTSKRLKALIKAGSLVNEEFEHVVVSRGTRRHDEHFTVTHRVQGDVQTLASVIRNFPIHNGIICNSATARESRLRKLLDISQAVGEFLDEKLKQNENQNPVEEIWVARTLSKCCGCIRVQAIFVGNSMPIRDMDTFGSEQSGGLRVRVVANRGASGIDGVVSSGIGFALGKRINTTIFLGDMSMLHDVNALHLLRAGGRGDTASLSTTVTIVVVNNGGGGIFSMLPIGKFTDLMTPTFDSQHAVHLRGICASFGIKYCAVRTLAEFRNALNDDGGEHMVIEVLVSGDHKLNAQAHSSLKYEVRNFADSILDTTTQNN